MLARRLLDAADAQALESIAGELAARALDGTVTPSGVDTGASALLRAYRSERRR